MNAKNNVFTRVSKLLRTRPIAIDSLESWASIFSHTFLNVELIYE